MVKLIEAYISESKSEQSRVRSNLEVLIRHMLKCKYQSEYLHKASWRKSIRNAFDAIVSEFKAVGKGSLYRSYYIKKLPLQTVYELSRDNAVDETGKQKVDFPNTCEWTKEQLTDKQFIYDFIDKYGQDITSIDQIMNIDN